MEAPFFKITCPGCFTATRYELPTPSAQRRGVAATAHVALKWGSNQTWRQVTPDLFFLFTKGPDYVVVSLQNPERAEVWTGRRSGFHHVATSRDAASAFLGASKYYNKWEVQKMPTAEVLSTVLARNPTRDFESIDLPLSYWQREPVRLRCSGCAELLAFNPRALCPACGKVGQVDETCFRCSGCNVSFNAVPLQVLRETLHWGAKEGPPPGPKPVSLVGQIFGNELGQKKRFDQEMRRFLFFQSGEALYREELAEWSEPIRIQALKNKDEQERREWGEIFSRVDQIKTLEGLDGSGFEVYLEQLFINLGLITKRTCAGADSGADLVIVSERGVRTAVQAKHATAPVGVSAIYELLGGMLNYSCAAGLVVTSSCFTNSAKALAAKDPRIRLWDRQKLQELAAAASAKPTPVFSSELFAEFKKQLSDLKLSTSPFRVSRRKRVMER